MRVPTCAPPCFPCSRRETNYKLAEADGSTDPTISLWFTHNGSFNNPDALNTLGASVSIPLRIFDRNQGEKLRTKIDIKRNEKLRQGVETQVYSDVDSAYATLNSNIDSAEAVQTPISGSRPCACATPFSFPTSMAARRCWIF